MQTYDTAKIKFRDQDWPDWV